MILPLQYAYLVGIGLFALVWVCIYAFKKNVRREMLIMSVLATLLGFTQFFFTHDYWQLLSAFPQGRFDVESFLLSFFYGGVAAPLYEVLFWKQPNYSSKPGNPYLALIVLAFALGATFLGVYGFHINSIYVSSAILFCVGSIIVVNREPLLKHALVTGVLFSLLMFFILQILIYLFPGIIEAWWKLGNLSGMFIYGVPIEEILSAFSWGFVAGPVSELVARLRFKL